MPKNIILLSDGTGNSEAKGHRTNVWRLYRALDLTQEDQVAVYDDGVGSQEFVLFRLWAGVFGWGLKRNVIELYSFLCQNFEEGDRIYIFGFSRGAFTARMLAGLICQQGLRQGFSPQELRKEVMKAYAAYRRARFPWGPKKLMNLLLGRQRNQLSQSVQAPEITAIGVWDTVDAYGLPIDELTSTWDYFIHTLRFPDLNLPPNVKQAYHALAIDDERQTFHPTMWNEADLLEDQKIEQVWFAGSHSDVGGGYSDDELALIALDWMMSKVEEIPGNSPEGLRFLVDDREYIKKHGYVHGRSHDPRSGLRAFYHRFKPRNIHRLSVDLEKGVCINTPKIHDSVFQRINQRVVPYTPIGIPEHYESVPSEQAWENPQQAKNRADRMEQVWDVVAIRRMLYLALFVLSVLMVGSKYFLDWEPGGYCEGSYCFLSPILQLLTIPELVSFIPSSVAGSIEALRQNPQWLIGFVIGFLLLAITKHELYQLNSALSGQAWKELRESKAEGPELQVGVPSTLIYKVRTNPALTFLFHGFTKKALPMAALVVLVIVPVMLMSRIVFDVRSTAGGICENGIPTNALEPGEFQTVDFSTKAPCLSSGIAVVKGDQYQITVEVDANEKWRDGFNVEADPNGFVDKWDSLKLALTVPTRRSWSAPWFSLLGRVGTAGLDRFTIGEGNVLTAKTDGPLFLFVNDAVCGFCPGRFWAWPYFWSIGENHGKAKVTVYRLKPGDSPKAILAESIDGSL